MVSRRRTAVGRSRTEKLATAGEMMGGLGSQSVDRISPCRAQSVSFLYVRLSALCVSQYRCDGAKIVRNGSAQQRSAQRICGSSANESQRRPLALTKWPFEERTGSR